MEVEKFHSFDFERGTTVPSPIVDPCLPMLNQPFGKTGDVESGARPLYPMMLESPELRWSFIRKVYSIVALQLLLTIGIGAVVVTVRPIATFFVTTSGGLALYIVIIITPFISTFRCFCRMLSIFPSSGLGMLLFFFSSFPSTLGRISKRLGLWGFLYFFEKMEWQMFPG